MPADEEGGPVLFDERTRPGAVFTGITADVNHQHGHAFTAEASVFRTIETEFLIIGIAIYPDQRVERSDRIHGVEPPAEVPCMPDLVHRLKELADRIREDSMRI